MRPSPGVALHFLLALSVSCLLAILAGLQASKCARGTRVVDLSFSSLCSALAYGFVLKSPAELSFPRLPCFLCSDPDTHTGSRRSAPIPAGNFVSALLASGMR